MARATTGMTRASWNGVTVTSLLIAQQRGYGEREPAAGADDDAHLG
ncbi:hypothetical protein AB0E63_43350 [Kribbella sp. NPDC026596]